MRTSCAREEACIFSITRARWISIVRWLSPRSAAMSLLGRPRVISCSTSRSRGVSDSSRARIWSFCSSCARFSRSRASARWMRSSRSWSRKGFCRKSKRAVLHGLYRHRHIAMAGHEDHRDDRAAQVQLFLQLQAAHARHAHVEHQAARLVRVVAGQKLVCRGVGLHRAVPRTS